MGRMRSERACRLESRASHVCAGALCFLCGDRARVEVDRARALWRAWPAGAHQKIFKYNLERPGQSWLSNSQNQW